MLQDFLQYVISDWNCHWEDSAPLLGYWNTADARPPQLFYEHWKVTSVQMLIHVQRSLVPLDPIVGQSRRSFSFTCLRNTMSLCVQETLCNLQRNIPHWAVGAFILCPILLHGAMGCGSSTGQAYRSDGNSVPVSQAYNSNGSSPVKQEYKSDYLQYLDSAAETEAGVFLVGIPFVGFQRSCQRFVLSAIYLSLIDRWMMPPTPGKARSVAARKAGLEFVSSIPWVMANQPTPPNVLSPEIMGFTRLFATKKFPPWFRRKSKIPLFLCKFHLMCPGYEKWRWKRENSMMMLYNSGNCSWNWWMFDSKNYLGTQHLAPFFWPG